MVFKAPGVGLERPNARAARESGPVLFASPASRSEAESDARSAAVLAVPAIVLARVRRNSCSRGAHVAVVAIVVALHVSRFAGSEAASVLVADQTDLVDVGRFGGADRRRVEGRGRSRGGKQCGGEGAQRGSPSKCSPSGLGDHLDAEGPSGIISGQLFLKVNSSSHSRSV